MSERLPFAKYARSGAYHWRAMSRSPRSHDAFLAARYAAVLRAGRPWAGRRVLDLGCGDGALSYLLHRRGAHVLGVDPDHVGLRLAREEHARRGAAIALAVGTGYDLPFAPRSFDRVVCSDVVEHLQRPDAALREIGRVLAPGGRAVVTTPRRGSGTPADPEHVRELLPGELRALMGGELDAVMVAGSHPLALRELYLYTARPIGRRPFRFAINVLSLLGANPFRLSGFRHHALLVATGVKAGTPRGDA